MSRKRSKLSSLKETEGGNNKRYRLHKDEAELIDNYRRFHNASVEQGLDPKTVKHGWFKSKRDSLFAKNPGLHHLKQSGLS